jgi:hypothetical protein
MAHLRHKATGELVIGTAEIQHFTQRISDVRALEWGEWEWGDDIRPMESETETDPADGEPLLVLESGATCKLAECELVEEGEG